MSDSNRRAQLSQFLKNCRARLSPGDVGLPEPCRRRTPGLRREDVAAIAGVSVTWYMWLEQGRGVRVSSGVLERLSRALRLSPDEREYLFELVHNRPPPLLPGQDDEVDWPILHMLQALPLPALVMTFRWDVVAWNDMVKAVFRDYDAMAPEERNLLRILFTHPQYREDADEFEQMARRVLARLRVDYSQAGEDPVLEALIQELIETCPTFRRLWTSPEVTARSEGVNAVRHPELGRISFHHTSYVPEGHPSLRVVIFAPGDAESADKLEQLRADT